MKSLIYFSFIFLMSVMLLSCDNDDYEEIITIINNSYNNTSDTIKNNSNNSNASNKNQGTISFGVSDLEQG